MDLLIFGFFSQYFIKDFTVHKFRGNLINVNATRQFIWHITGRVADPGGVDLDPTLEKKPGSVRREKPGLQNIRDKPVQSGR